MKTLTNLTSLHTLLAAIALLTGAATTNAQRMNTEAMRSNAHFLTDRMAYTLNIYDPYLIDEIYRINYDYIHGVNDYLDDISLGYYQGDYIALCEARDHALRNLLGPRLWSNILRYTYFHRPITFANRRWHFAIYDHDRYGPRHFHLAPPRPLQRGYTGGHYLRPMAPRGRADRQPGRHGTAPTQSPTTRGNARTTPTRGGKNGFDSRNSTGARGGRR